MLLASFGAFAQLKVESDGTVKIGDKLTIGTSGSYFGLNAIYPNNVYLGKTNQFWEVRSATFWSYQYAVTSDMRLKENLQTIDQPLEKILKLTGKKYDYILDENDKTGTTAEQENKIKLKKDHLGFVAQEVLDIIPEAVIYNKEEDIYLINYNTFIPVIVEAMKEQQATINELQASNDDLTARIEKLEGNTAKEKSATIGDDKTPATLNQNIPNPFSANTTINMYIPNTVTKAVLYIYTMQGEQIQKLTINERGNTSATIEGRSLKAGMYLYTLIADGREVDTKKMILTK